MLRRRRGEDWGSGGGRQGVGGFDGSDGLYSLSDLNVVVAQEGFEGLRCRTNLRISS